MVKHNNIYSEHQLTWEHLRHIAPLTYAVFGAVVFLGEFVAVTQRDLAAPDVQHSTNRQVTVVVEIFVHGTSLIKITLRIMKLNPFHAQLTTEKVSKVAVKYVNSRACVPQLKKEKKTQLIFSRLRYQNPHGQIMVRTFKLSRM